MMKKYSQVQQSVIRWVLLIFLFCLIGQKSKATHLIGSDFNYEWVFDNTYDVYFTFYRDCSGMQVGSDHAFLELRLDSCGPVVFSQWMNYMGVSTGSPFCSLIGNPCTTGARVNSQAHKFYLRLNFNALPANIGAIAVPRRFPKWYLSVVSTARPTIRNINFTPSLYSAVMLNNFSYQDQNLIQQTVENSNPVNLNNEFGFRFVCLNKETSLSLALLDPDGDSLSYELIRGKDDCNTFIDYNSLNDSVSINNISYPAMPFTYQAPLPSFKVEQRANGNFAVPYCNFNEITGNLLFKPIVYKPNTISEFGINKYLLSYLIKEYRKIGNQTILVGQTIKEVIFVVEDCGTNSSAPVPSLTVPSSSNAQISVDSIITLKLPTCNYSEIDLSFNDSANSDLRLFLKYTNHNIERFLGGPFLYSIIQGDSSSNPKIKLVFQPDASMVDNHYSLILRVEKNSCPLKITKDYFLRIIIEDKSFGEIRSPIDRAIVGVCEGDPLPLTAIANRPDSTADAPASYRYKWDLAPGLNPADSNQAAIIVRPTTETRYRVSIANLAMGACTDTASILVKVKPYPSNLRILGVNGARAVAQGPNLIYRWYDMNNRLIGTVDTFTSHNPGQFYLEVTDTSFGTHCTVRSADFLLLTNGKSLGSYFKLYPNPASNTVKIEGLTEESSITFINSVGQKIEFNRINAAQINISSLKPGLYIVEAKHHGQVFRQHLIIEN